jgi:cysteine desulfurase
LFLYEFGRVWDIIKGMMYKPAIYLDHAATTPLDARVIEAMRPYFGEIFGNPSSIHAFGQQADAALEDARRRMAEILHCQPDEIVFTSGGSESDNLALRGTAFAMRQQKSRTHILISPIEHHAILRTAQQLRDHFGFELEFIPTDRFGIIDPQNVATRIKPSTAIVSVIYANNEIGTINPIKEIAEVCKLAGVPFHTDAVQAGAHLPIDLREINVDLLSLGAHKFYGPKGTGVLYVRKGTPLVPIQTGGSQEFGLRAGTHNIPYIIGMSQAFYYAQTESDQRKQYLLAMRDHLIGNILEEVPGAHLTGHPRDRLPNHASFVFEGIDGNQLTMMLDVEGFACSSGSACKTGSPEPSEVLIALGFSPELALGSLRVTLGASNTRQEIDLFLDCLIGILKRARKSA